MNTGGRQTDILFLFYKLQYVALVWCFKFNLKSYLLIFFQVIASCPYFTSYKNLLFEEHENKTEKILRIVVFIFS